MEELTVSAAVVQRRSVYDGVIFKHSTDWWGGWAVMIGH